MRNNKARFSNPYFPKKESVTNIRQWFTKGDGWAYLGSIVLIVIVIGYVWVQQRWLYIDYITVTGNNFLTVQQITDPAEELLNKRVWGIVPKRFYSAFKPNEFRDDLYEQLSSQYALEYLDIKVHFYDRIEILLEERVPGYVYTIGAGHYYMDDLGVLTEQVLDEKELNPYFPRIRDTNSRTVTVGDTVIQAERVSFMSDLVRDFTDSNGLGIAELSFEEVTCQKKQFVAEEIFETEIEDTEDDSIRAEKEFILEKLQNDEITVDQSLALLEEVKRLEFDDEDGEGIINPNGGFIELKAEFVPAECDYLAVLQDLSVITQDGPIIHFDTTIDLQTQLDNLNVVLRQDIEDLSTIEYIDVRFQDKVFYK